jgi:cytochrome b subunit of formate dehydrogenase
MNRQERYLRFHWTQRVEHVLLILTFTTLAVTGLAQKYANAGVSQAVLKGLGGIENTRTIHHIAAALLMFEVIYHLVDMGYKVIVRRSRMTMLPTLKDFRDAWQSLLYNVGLRKQRPQGERYTFEEKAEYWALIWGTAIMAMTGFIMWNPIATTNLLPGQVIPAAKAAHGAEAVLAVLAIILWHMYGVHIKRFNRSMWTGTMTEAEMIHEHPLELADLKAGTAQVALDPRTLRRRRLVYLPIAGILAAGMLVGLGYFISYEKTAIETVPPAVSVPVYAPQTPTAVAQAAIPVATITEPTAGAPGVSNWENTIGPMLAKQCTICHGAVNPTSGLSLVSYQAALAGGAGGPGFVPGDSAASRLVIVQSAGGHPGQLSPNALTLLKAWIESGAPEN